MQRNPVQAKMDKRIKDGIYVLDGSEFWDIKYKNLIPSMNAGTRKKLANNAKNFPGL